MAFWRLYYHLVWATKERHPLISANVEPVLYDYIKGKGHSLGSIIHAMGGVEDHVHLVVSVPPKLSIADYVQQIKGSRAHYVNYLKLEDLPAFGWQRGYGVMSLGSKQVETAVQYVRNQKVRHQQNDVILGLEVESHDNNGPALRNKPEDQSSG